jgi:hypothetical protein
MVLIAHAVITQSHVGAARRASTAVWGAGRYTVGMLFLRASTIRLVLVKMADLKYKVLQIHQEHAPSSLAKQEGCVFCFHSWEPCESNSKIRLSPTNFYLRIWEAQFDNFAAVSVELPEPDSLAVHQGAHSDPLKSQYSLLLSTDCSTFLVVLCCATRRSHLL